MAVIVDVVRTRGSDAIVLWGARHDSGGLAVGDGDVRYVQKEFEVKIFEFELLFTQERKFMLKFTQMNYIK